MNITSNFEYFIFQTNFHVKFQREKRKIITKLVSISFPKEKIKIRNNYPSIFNFFLVQQHFAAEKFESQTLGRGHKSTKVELWHNFVPKNQKQKMRKKDTGKQTDPKFSHLFSTLLHFHFEQNKVKIPTKCKNIWSFQCNKMRRTSNLLQWAWASLYYSNEMASFYASSLPSSLNKLMPIWFCFFSFA